MRGIIQTSFAFFVTMVLIFPTLYTLFGIDGKPHDFGDCVYFSLVTATTTGYGDITPKGAGRVIAVFQLLLTMIYVAFVIPIVVSLSVSDSRN